MDQASTSAMSGVNVTDDHKFYPPSWMNEEFFTEVLRKCEKTDDILVKEVQLFTATAKGANYGIVCFQSAVSYDRENSKGKSKSLIIKTLTEMDDHKNDVFEAEISIYSEAIPKFEAEFSKSGDSTIFGAEVLYYSLEPRKVIVFENLCSKGYERLRDRYCNSEEGKTAFLKLAKWHAVSYKLAAEINGLNITPASAKGDHYASVMFRATIKYDSSTSKGLSKSIIVKTAPELDGHKKDLLKEMSVFETEIGMYSKTIPKFEEELRKIGDNTVLGARALYYSLEPRKCIIFEDIVPKGYETLRDRPLNLEEAKAALTKLAKWHAVSYKLAAEGDESIANYEHGIFSSKEDNTLPFIKTGIKNFIAKLETIDDLKQYVPKLRSIEDDVLKRCIKSSKSYKTEKPEGIFALCHGDFHCKNLMFKRNDKTELEDVMLIDFQVCYFGPVVMDILYGMYMLVDENLRIDKFDEIIHHYAACFIDTLKKMQFRGKIPQVFEFFIDILRHRHMELFMLSTFVPMWYVLEIDASEIEDILFSEDTQKKLYDTPGYIKQIRRVLPNMFYRGYLD